MSGKEVVNLIYALKKKGMTADEIIDIILFIGSDDNPDDHK